MADSAAAIADEVGSEWDVDVDMVRFHLSKPSPKWKCDVRLMVRRRSTI